MNDLIEIRWHGRGGQGAKTASLLLADAAFNTGKYIQGFPEYGAERMGAPITAYNRISTTPIRIHCNIYNPDYVVVVDDTLLNSVDVPKVKLPEELGFSTGEVNYYTLPNWGKLLCRCEVGKNASNAIFSFEDVNLTQQEIEQRLEICYERLKD